MLKVWVNKDINTQNYLKEIPIGQFLEIIKSSVPSPPRLTDIFIAEDNDV